MPTVRVAPAGIRGFDCNAVLSDAQARAMFSAGYRFAVRYIRRGDARDSDLSAAEVSRLHRAGLAVMPVQHVERDSAPWWTPSDDKGRQYGEAAVAGAKAAGIPSGVTVWLDLEGIVPATPHETVIRYGNYWHGRVKPAGYHPGLYVGYGALLTPDELYARLLFDLYWAAGNLNLDQYPARRGVCMRQHWAKPADVPAGAANLSIDTDDIRADAFGGLPFLYAPDEWAV